MKPLSPIIRLSLTSTLLAAVCVLAAPIRAEDKKADEGAAKEIDCELKFSMESWSILYKAGEGEGTISCDNGQKVPVALKTRGGGLTVGKAKIIEGKGDFSKVHSIDELFGSYATAEAHAAAGDAAMAQALTKGEVSLALSGTGKGVNLGFDFGKFTITKK